MEGIVGERNNVIFLYHSVLRYLDYPAATKARRERVVMVLIRGLIY